MANNVLDKLDFDPQKCLLRLRIGPCCEDWHLGVDDIPNRGLWLKQHAKELGRFRVMRSLFSRPVDSPDTPQQEQAAIRSTLRFVDKVADAMGWQGYYVTPAEACTMDPIGDEVIDGFNVMRQPGYNGKDHQERIHVYLVADFREGEPSD